MLDDIGVGQRREGAAFMRRQPAAVSPSGPSHGPHRSPCRARHGAAGAAAAAMTSAVTSAFGMPAALSRRSKRKILARRADAVAIQRVGPAQFAEQRARIGVEQQLVRVEAMAFLRPVRPMHAIAIGPPRRDAGKVAVPDAIGAFRQVEARPRAARCGRTGRARRGWHGRRTARNSRRHRRRSRRADKARPASSRSGRRGMGWLSVLQAAARPWRAAAGQATTRLRLRPCAGTGSADEPAGIADARAAIEPAHRC